LSRNRKFVGLIAVLLIFSFALAGCGGGSSTPAAPAANGGDNGLPEVKWTLQTGWSVGWLIHDMAIRVADDVRAMSGGKFDIEVLPAGAIVGSLEVMDACKAGTIDAYHSWTAYWVNQHPAAPLFASVPMGMEPAAHMAWMYAGGGKEYQQQMYDELQSNIKIFPCGITHPEVLVHSNKPVYVIEDFNSLKYRAPGWWGEILRGVGVAVTLLPSPELYPSMEKGVIDAVEFNIPFVNKQMGFHEVSTFIGGPGMHQPTCNFELGVNKKSWDALPPEYQKMLEFACVESSMWSWTLGSVEDIKVLREWNAPGSKWTLTKFSVEDQHEIRELSWNYIDKSVESNAMAKKAWQEYKDFFAAYSDYEWFLVPERPIVADADREFGSYKK
jgi:TRAP-type mannitol/chloroaromatic compound transport system substrate-binding protein